MGSKDEQPHNVVALENSGWRPFREKVKVTRSSLLDPDVWSDKTIGKEYAELVEDLSPARRFTEYLAYQLSRHVRSTTMPSLPLIEVCVESAMQEVRLSRKKAPVESKLVSFLRGLYLPAPEALEWAVYIDKRLVPHDNTWDPFHEALCDWWERFASYKKNIARRDRPWDSSFSDLPPALFRRVLLIKAMRGCDHQYLQKEMSRICLG